MNVKLMIEDIFNKYKDKRGIKLTDNFKEYINFRIIIG
jgi:hypothetical protein